MATSDLEYRSMVSDEQFQKDNVCKCGKKYLEWYMRNWTIYKNMEGPTYISLVAFLTSLGGTTKSTN